MARGHAALTSIYLDPPGRRAPGVDTCVWSRRSARAALSRVGRAVCAVHRTVCRVPCAAHRTFYLYDYVRRAPGAAFGRGRAGLERGPAPRARAERGDARGRAGPRSLSLPLWSLVSRPSPMPRRCCTCTSRVRGPRLGLAWAWLTRVVTHVVTHVVALAPAATLRGVSEETAADWTRGCAATPSSARRTRAAPRHARSLVSTDKPAGAVCVASKRPSPPGAV